MKNSWGQRGDLKKVEEKFNLKLAGKICEIEMDPEKFLVNQIDYTIFFLNYKK